VTALDQATIDRRLSALTAAIGKAGLDAAAIIPGSNFLYLTGGRFHAMERPTILIVTASGERRAVLPAFEVMTWEKLGFAAEVFPWKDSEGYDGATAAAVAGLRIGRLGVEGQRMRVFEEMALQKAIPGVTIVDAHKAISAIRLHKDRHELHMMREAIHVSEAALEKTLKEIRLGVTEREVESELLRNLYAGGAKEMAFAPLVLGGAQAAEPHGHAGGYRLRRGDTLLFDFGAAEAGYNADITRTVFVGEPEDDARAFYETVREANAIGRDAVRPGMTASAVDDAVQRFLEASPFAANIVHKTGHGLGLDVHEAPQVMRGDETVLEPGMVITIEPGLYVPGLRGVRIEDDVVVTESGAESLTRFPRELRVVG
jgi:Xaa-Pro dipeptidase